MRKPKFISLLKIVAWIFAALLLYYFYVIYLAPETANGQDIGVTLSEDYDKDEHESLWKRLFRLRSSYPLTIAGSHALAVNQKTDTFYLPVKFDSILAVSFVRTNWSQDCIFKGTTGDTGIIVEKYDSTLTDTLYYHVTGIPDKVVK